MKNDDKWGFQTRAIHVGEPPSPILGAVTLPIFQSSTFQYDGELNYGDIRYLRLNNSPNHLCLHEKLASLENAESGVVTASGMAAITTALLSVVGPGEDVVAQESLYGGTHHFLKYEMPRLGRGVKFFDSQDLSVLDSLIDKKTRAVYVESTSNPLLRIPDLPAIAALARRHGIASVIDNTFASPVNCNPADYGFDLVLHSATKYLNGHTDIVAGCAVGRAGLIKEMVALLNHLGGCLDPHTCFLLNRGLKTLFLRVTQQNATALALAGALQRHPRIAKVIYPGLSAHPDHIRAKKLMRGFGAMVSFEFKGTPVEADAFLNRLKFAFIAPSLGGVETLVTRPATTSHSGVSPEDRARCGISDTLIRVSVGVEDEADLIADFRQALG